MIYSYCKRCRMESAGDVCVGCGKRATAALQRDKWSILTLPLADSRAWRTSILALFGAAALVVGAVFGLEALFGGPARVSMLWQSAVSLTVSQHHLHNVYAVKNHAVPVST